ncbi:hypothetical protein AGABI2DRAFT_121061 [Agaricus bisporus var. bisporus H97]|uniref:hypothetical protein n=1 Tax=Agaricus bisporus var. bisporus (strain H97 / ATCC MYA-4626 / FGSC 10389) TaxID=936046 RepID=UPI00029F6C9D|nr:hypothetical protein AGABI2DRAFT_121061 [Agaricus bisporus var. bisporus H97]EKV43852.1 hypothetical protein AGABI2DRAFT_121061 [Agaricus bisporus var. bisporus H97]
MSPTSPTATSTTRIPSSCRTKRHGFCYPHFPGMIFLLFIFTLVAGLLEAPMSPVRFFYRDPLAIILYTRCEDDCMLVFHTQFILSLIMSCMTTICLTTAVAAHPDIPGPGESSYSSLKKFIWPIIFPFGMLLKAFRQLLAARTIAQLYNEARREEVDNQKLLDSERNLRRSSLSKSHSNAQSAPPMEWTQTHGFYVVMGGLMLYKDKQPLYTLQYSTVERLHRTRQIDLPAISKRDILNRSKDGIVSKAMALFQVIYFIQDYVRRWKRERSVIDLELVTMVYIVINALTFVLYWHKPFYILHPTKVQLKEPDKLHRKKHFTRKSLTNSQSSS